MEKKRVVCRKGSVFCARFDDKFKCYLQYITDDSSLLNANVIRAFKKKYPIDYVEDIEEIVNGEIAFYTHCMVKWGLDLGELEKVGSSRNLGLENLKDVIWGTFWVSFPWRIPDLNKWKLWITDGEQVEIGKLNRELVMKVEIGYIFAAHEVRHRLEFGYFKMRNAAYSIKPRIPYPDVDSYVCQDIDYCKLYIHFKGDIAVEELVFDLKKGKTARLTKEKPEAKGYRLRKEPFHATNWFDKEFITKKDFDQLWYVNP